MPASDEPSNDARPFNDLGVSLMQQVKKLEDVIASLPGMSVHPHQFGAREFRLGNLKVPDYEQVSSESLYPINPAATFPTRHGTEGMKLTFRAKMANIVNKRCF
jgi:hypothetical protein